MAVELGCGVSLGGTSVLVVVALGVTVGEAVGVAVPVGTALSVVINVGEARAVLVAVGVLVGKAFCSMRHLAAKKPVR